MYFDKSQIISRGGARKAAERGGKEREAMEGESRKDAHFKGGNTSP